LALSLSSRQIAKPLKLFFISDLAQQSPNRAASGA
jgi:hypothetical protein